MNYFFTRDLLVYYLKTYFIKMINADLRYFVVQNNEVNNEMIPIIDNNLVLCGTHFSISCVACWFIFNSLIYLKIIAKYVWKLLWNSLTPSRQLFELTVISVIIVSGILLLNFIQGMSDVLDDGFVKLKNEIRKKD